MANKITSIPICGTAEQKAKLDAVMENMKDTPAR
jgi:hypothetical protein